MDLRDRVVKAVESGRMSCRGAASHFGVAASSAIKWMQRYRQTGSAAPGQIGGYRPRAISGAHRDWLIARCRSDAFTLRGLVAELSAERGLKVDYRSVWSFVHEEGLSFKKNRARPRTGSTRHRPASRSVARLPAAD
jgi:putative transposase